VRALLLAGGPRFVRDAFGPMLAFYLGWRLLPCRPRSWAGRSGTARAASAETHRVPGIAAPSHPKMEPGARPM